MFTISYDIEGGTLSLNNPLTFYITSTDFKLNKSTKKGYMFKGWTGTGLETSSKNVEILNALPAIVSIKLYGLY